jgi:hypothetical protein
MDTNKHESAAKETTETTDLKLAHFPARSSLPIAALPSMPPVPSAPFTDGARSALECDAAMPTRSIIYQLSIKAS